MRGDAGRDRGCLRVIPSGSIVTGPIRFGHADKAVRGIDGKLPRRTVFAPEAWIAA